MKKKSLNKFDNLIYFTKENLRTLGGGRENTISQNVSRWLKSGDIIRLKNGVYTTKNSYNKYHREEGYQSLIANILRSPSYVSLEYVLAESDILTEAAYPITSVTLKNSRTYQNPTGTYIYHSISHRLFTGYLRKHYLEHEYLIAAKAKALFDYLYFKANSLANNFEGRNLVEDLRLKLDSFTPQDFKELEGYLPLAKSKKISLIVKNIIKNASH